MPKGRPKKNAPVTMTALAKILKETPGALELSNRKLRKNGLETFLQKVLLTFAPSQVTAAMSTIGKLALNGDLEAAKVVLQVYSVLQRGAGVSVVTNIQNNNSASGNGGANFDSLVRQMSPPTIDVTPGN
jgi:hypothetical protein